MARQNHTQNAVRITYYSELPNVRSYEKFKRRPFSMIPHRRTTSKCSGYDRRAELLAYANHLRQADLETVHWPRKCQTSNPKKRKWSAAPASVHALIHRILKGARGRWAYERVRSEEEIKSRDKKKEKEKNSSGKSISQFCRKLKCILRGLSFGGRCRKM